MELPFADQPFLIAALIWFSTLVVFDLALGYATELVEIEMTDAQSAIIVGVSGLVALVPLIGPILCVLVAVAMLRFMCEADYLKAFGAVGILYSFTYFLLVGLESWFSTH